MPRELPGASASGKWALGWGEAGEGPFPRGMGVGGLRSYSQPQKRMWGSASYSQTSVGRQEPA